MNLKYNAAEYNMIYIYSVPYDDHKGMLKIGKTSFYSLDSIAQLPPNCPRLNQAAHQCIYTQTHRANIRYDLLYTELAMLNITMNDGSVQTRSFDDYAVHDVLLNSNYRFTVFEESGNRSEWFVGDLDTAIAAIKAVKNGLDRLPTAANEPPRKKKTEIVLRKEQEENVAKTIEIFQTHDTMLWDCKMRYGKTVTAYELIRRQNLQGKFYKTIVVTHRPAVQDGWGADHDLIFSPSQHLFLDKTNGRVDYDSAIDAENDRQLKNAVKSGKPFVYFASIQDLRGSKRVNSEKGFDKNNSVFDLDWDLIIIDEAHEGTRTELGDAVIKALKKEHTKILSLSGTPYNIMSDFGDENKYTWTYVDEQRAKQNWEIEHPGEKNPYEDLPTMNIYTFDITEQIPESYRYVTEDSAFNFREFFRVWTGDRERDYRDMPAGARPGDFVYAKDVYQFLSLISKDDPESNYPFSTDEFRDMFAHTFWLVPGVAAARALSAMLKTHPRFKDYYVVNIAGDGDEEQPYDEALGLVKSAIKTYPKTISISCGKLTTGVTVKEWTGVMMLSGSASTAASGYMQAIFRVQSPGCVNGKQKKNCYVFDFAPDRTLKVIAEVHHIRHKRGGSDDEKAKQILGEFLNFCPVIAVEGTVMRTYDVPEMMRQIKRISVEAAINSGFDDDTIYKSDAGIVVDKFDAEILRKLSDVVAPKKKSKKQTDVIITKNGLTEEERKKAEKAKNKPKRERTKEEIELLEKLKKQREEQKKMFDLLRAVSIRLPLLFYGVDADITQIIHLKDFVDLVDEESWEEFMPQGLKKTLFLDILRYYDEDVVTGAGLRIRKLAKAADELPPMLRAKRIVEILSRFKNPDKETVLTPWRVVNMHMGDTIGGMNFFDEAYEKELDDPRMVEQGNVTADLLLNPNVKVLEMNSKSGLYPLYLAYSIYYMYVDGNERTFPLEKAQALWAKTLKDNIFVLCKTKMARTITIRTLAGYSGMSVNAIYLPRLVDSWMREKKEKLANKLRNPSTWGKEGEKMKFDAIVGNPPYQVMDSDLGRGASPIYPLFVETAKCIQPNYISIIMPARWYGGGKGLDDFRAEMLADRRIEKLVDFESSKDCFSSADIAGGVCYFLWNSDKDSPTCEITNVISGIRHTTNRELNQFNVFIRSNAAIRILQKVLSFGEESVEKYVLSQKPFGFRTYERGNQTSSDNSIALITSDGIRYVDRGSVSKNAEYIDKYKIIVGRFVPSNGELDVKPGEGYRVTTSAKILNPGEICTETYVVIGIFDNLVEAQGYLSYYRTKFARFLLRLSLSSVNISREMFKYVPDQDFKMLWNDAALYKKYGLTEDEIRHVESTIKPMGD